MFEDTITKHIDKNNVGYVVRIEDEKSFFSVERLTLESLVDHTKVWYAGTLFSKKQTTLLLKGLNIPSLENERLTLYYNKTKETEGKAITVVKPVKKRGYPVKHILAFLRSIIYAIFYPLFILITTCYAVVAYIIYCAVFVIEEVYDFFCRPKTYL
ncbi:hypothetical protein D3C71_1220480 [compost metagenome]